MAALAYNPVTLTEVSTGSVIILPASAIMYVVASGSDSKVTYDDGSGILQTKTFDETQAAIVTDATCLLNVTISSVTTSINVFNIKSFVASGGSDTKVYYLTNRSVPDPFVATGITPAALKTAIEAL